MKTATASSSNSDNMHNDPSYIFIHALHEQTANLLERRLYRPITIGHWPSDLTPIQIIQNRYVSRPTPPGDAVYSYVVLPHRHNLYITLDNTTLTIATPDCRYREKLTIDMAHPDSIARATSGITALLDSLDRAAADHRRRLAERNPTW